MDISRDLVSRVTDKVTEQLAVWQARPLDCRVYPVLLIDALYVKIRDGQVSNRPVYVAVGINLIGERDVLGMWVGTGGEGCSLGHHARHHPERPLQPVSAANRI